MSETQTSEVETTDRHIDGIDAALNDIDLSGEAPADPPPPDIEEAIDAVILDDPPEEIEATEEDTAPAIDYDQEIPMPGGGDPVKLGELKDRLVKAERTEAAMIDRENDLMRRSDEFSQALQAAGGEIPPALKEQMAAAQTAHLESEHNAMMKAIPEWKDRAVFDEDRKAIAAVGKDYGFSPQEVSNIMDHRVVKFMRDYSRLKAKEVKARENVQQIHARSTPKGAKPRPVSDKAKLNNQISKAQTIEEKVRAVDQLLNSG